MHTNTQYPVVVHLARASAAMDRVGSYEDEDEDSDNETEESVELDEITVRSFLKICMDAGMLRGWCQNYGKRPHTTGGAKVRVLDKFKH